MCVCSSGFVCVRARVHVCVCVCARVHVCVCVCDLLAGEEEEDVSRSLLTEMDLYHSTYGGLNVVSLWLWREEYLHRMCATWDALCVCMHVLMSPPMR